MEEGSPGKVEVYRKKFRPNRARQSNLKYRLRMATKVCGNFFPRLYLQVMRRRHRNYYTFERIAGPSTNIVIEGFPRSGNSFSVRAFTNTQDRKVSVAHHLHSWGNLYYAKKHSIPGLVLIRKPGDVIVSLAVHAIEQKAVPAGIDPKDLLLWNCRYYLAFYSRVECHLSYFCVATFEQVTSNFGAVIENLNKHYKCDFSTFDHNDDNVREVFEGGGEHLSPSGVRNKRKEMFAEALHDSDVMAMLAKAEKLYARIVEKQ